jgi:hypothetical protein
MELAFRHSPVNFGDRKRQANCNRECPLWIKSRHDEAAVGRFLLNFDTSDEGQDSRGDGSRHPCMGR